MKKKYLILFIFSLVLLGASCTKKTVQPAVNNSNILNSLKQAEDSSNQNANQSTTNINQNLNTNTNINSNSNINTNSNTNTNANSNINTSQSEPEEKTVSIKDLAFQPAVLTITAGTKVTWINEDAISHQIASNPHPAHTDLPGLVSGVLSTDEDYSFTFTASGTFGYHCHLHPSMSGTIIVE